MASLPAILVEVSMISSTTSTDLILDDAARGLLDTGTLAEGEPWTDVSAYVRSFSTQTGRNRPTETFKPGTATVVLDNSEGRFDPENLSGPYVAAGETQLVPMTPIRISAVWDGIAYPLFTGYADAWSCQYPGMYDAITVVSITDAQKVLAKLVASAASSPVGEGESPGDRIDRILDLWNWPAGERNIETGLNTLQATTLAQPALEEIDGVVASEYGDFFIDPSGRPEFAQRYARSTRVRSINSQVTFSDVQADVEASSAVGYTDIARVGDGDLIRNTVTRGNVGGEAQSVTDVDSVARYQTVTDVKTDLVNDSDAQALVVAQWIVGLFGQWEQRVAHVDVMPAGHPDPSYAWPLLLALRFLDQVTVVRTPPNVSQITGQHFVDGLDWSGDASNWTVKVYLASATGQLGLFILDDTTLGILDDGVLAA